MQIAAQSNRITSKCGVSHEWNNIDIWTPCSYQHYTFHNCLSILRLGLQVPHWQNCATEPTVGFQGSLLPGKKCFLSVKYSELRKNKKNLHKRHSLIREVVCHIPLSRTLHIPTGDNLWSFSPNHYLHTFFWGEEKNVFFYASPLRKWDSTYHWLSAAYANPGELAMYWE